MPLRVVCPSCGATLTAPNEAIGKTSRCPSCQTPIKLAAAVDHPRGQAPVPTDFALPAEEPPAATPINYPPPVRIAPPQGPVVRPGHEFPNEDYEIYKACPFCGEDIRDVAKKCKHCGETLDPAMRAAEEARRWAQDGYRDPEPRQTIIVHNESYANASAVASSKSRPPPTLSSCLGCLLLVIAAAVGVPLMIAACGGLGSKPVPPDATRPAVIANDQGPKAKAQKQPTPLASKMKPEKVSPEQNPDLKFLADDWIKQHRKAELAAWKKDMLEHDALLGKVVQISGTVRHISAVPGKDEVVVCLVGPKTKETEGVFFSLTTSQASVLAKGQAAVVRGRIEGSEVNGVPVLELVGCIVGVPK